MLRSRGTTRRGLQVQASGGLMLVLCALSSLGCMSLPLSTEERKSYWQLESDSFEQPRPEAVCHLHHVATESRWVLVRDGMCVEDSRYAKAKVRLFPNAFKQVLSCACEHLGDRFVVRQVCPVCREAEEAWGAQHPR